MTSSKMWVLACSHHWKGWECQDVRLDRDVFRGGGRKSGDSSRRKGKEFSASCHKDPEVESREGPSKFTGSPGCINKTTKAGGRSTIWPESRRETRGLQTWGGRNQINNNAPETTNAQDSQQTAPKERPRTRVRAKARPGTPSHPQTSPSYPFSSCGALYSPPQMPPLWRHSQMSFSLYHPIQLTIPTPHPIMKTYFPLTTLSSLT